MDFVPAKDTSDKPDSRPSFRKPSNDSANRKYRHHSPVDGSDSSSSGGSGKHEQNISPGNSLANRSEVSDNRTRKYHGKEPKRGPGHSHSSRGSDSYRYSDKQAYKTSRDYQHSDDGRYHRLADDEDKDSALHSKYGQELRSGRHDCAKHSYSFERSKETSRNADRNEERYHSRDKYENSGRRNRGKDREVNVPDHKYNEKESFRAPSGSRQITSRRDNKRDDEWERLRERDDRDNRRIRHRSPSDYRKEYASTPEDSRGHSKDSFIGRETVGYRLKESQRKEIDEQDCQAHKRRYNDKDNKKYEDKYSLDPDENRKKESDSFSVYQAREEKSDGYVDKNSNATEEQSSSKRLKLGKSDKFPLSMAEGKPSSSSKQVNDSTEKFTLGLTGSANNHTEAAQDLNAAKFAAMKAAELVNKNLVGTGFMSTDQKKKLLWGSKKNSSEESGNRWDLQLFSDRERQEKFNKLMSLRLPWYVWPIVGCERRGNSSRAQARRKGCGEAEGAADRFGETVHCRFATQRWPHSWSWSVIIFFCFRARNLVLKEISHGFVIFCNEFNLNVVTFLHLSVLFPWLEYFLLLYEGWLAVPVGFIPLVSDQDRLKGIVFINFNSSIN